MEALTSSIVTAARIQPVPAGQDMAQVAAQLLTVSSTMGEAVAYMKKIFNGMTKEQEERVKVREGLMKLDGTLAIMNGELRFQREVVVNMAQSIDRLCEVTEANSEGTKTVMGAMVGSQQGLAKQMKLQGDAFKAIHNRFAGLIEDEQRGGQVTSLVRNNHRGEGTCSRY